MKKQIFSNVRFQDFRTLKVLLFTLAFFSIPLLTHAATITVNSNGDSRTATDGNCDLAEAIDNANGDTDFTGGDCAAGSGADDIVFSVGTDAQIITISSDLPSVTSEVHVDGTTQPGGSPASCSPRNLYISIDGNGATQKIFYFLTGSANSTVKGLNLYGTTIAAIDIATDSITVQCNHIGTDLAGTGFAPNTNQDTGIRFEGPANLSLIGGTGEVDRNIVSGNNNTGIWLIGNIPSDVEDNIIQGNYIGTDITGTFAISNGAHGIALTNADNNVIGGTNPGQGNVISGNNQGGVNVLGNSNTFLGNFIGTDTNGTAGILNNGNGVNIVQGSLNVIGGANTGDRNVIGGNTGSGVSIIEGDGNIFQGNLIGIDVNGNTLGNGNSGISIGGGPGTRDSNVIGGNRLNGEGNVISGNNGNGVSLQSTTNTTIKGNILGLNSAGNSPISNNGSGIDAILSDIIVIGGSVAGEGNIISGNNNNGIHYDSTTNTQIEGNYIGTDITGLLPIANSIDGITLANLSNNNVIGGSVVGEGNIISGNNQNGINLQDGDNNVIQGNLIGVDLNGTTALGNSIGVNLGGCGTSCDSNIIGGNRLSGEGNVISGNFNAGISLFDATSTTIRGNIIGMTSNGLAALGNSNVGINVNLSDNTLIGGALNGQGNIISGNGQGGISLFQATNSKVYGNFVGLDIVGNPGFGHPAIGIAIQDSTLSTIGGPLPGQRNIIAGNGIFAFGTANIDIGNDASLNTIQGNWIGVDANQNAVTSAGFGFNVRGHDNLIGGSNPGEGNVISGNGSGGVVLDNGEHPGFPPFISGNKIQGNYIGTAPSGQVVAGFGNTNLAGVILTFDAQDNLVGGTNDGEGNIIAGNTGNGVYFFGIPGFGGADPVRNAVLGNSIFDNTAFGIDAAVDSNADLTADTHVGTDPNDPGDSDVGPNDYLNHPVIAQVIREDVNVTVTYSLDVPVGNYRVEFFENTVGDPNGSGEGETFVGAQSVTSVGAPMNYNYTFIYGGVGVLSATVTEDLGGTYGSTSEFSPNMQTPLSGSTTTTVVQTPTPSTGGSGGFISDLKPAALLQGQASSQQAQSAASTEPKDAGCQRTPSVFPFPDAEKHWAKEEIQYLYNRCVIDGKRPRQFAPDQPITRAEVTKIVLRLFALFDEKAQSKVLDLMNQADAFKDIKSNDWFAAYVTQGFTQKLVKGYQLADGSFEFRPNQPITRAEALKILLSAASVDLKGSKVSYADVKPEDWFHKYVAYATEQGFIEGYKNSKDGAAEFRPNQPITRAEFSKIGAKVHQRTLVKQQAFANYGLASVFYPTFMEILGVFLLVGGLLLLIVVYLLKISAEFHKRHHLFKK